MRKLVPGRCELVFLLALLCAHSTCWSQEPIAGASPSSRATKEAREQRDLLQFISVPSKALPKHVRLVKRIRTASLIPVTKNPDVFVDPQRIKTIAAFFGMRAKPDLEPVRAGVVAIYQENDPAKEIGVYGLYFSDKKSANAWFKKLTKDKKGSPFFLKGKLLLYVWKDDGVSNVAFKSIQDYFKAAKFNRVRSPPTAEQPP